VSQPYGHPPPGFIWPVLKPADIESLMLFFLTPIVAPAVVATRLPNETLQTDIATGFVRVEAGGGPKISLTHYNQTCLLHVYSPFEFEVSAGQLAQTITAYVSAAGGLNVGGFQVVDVPHCTTWQRRTDPQVNLLRYLSYVTWTVQGQWFASAV
jgi:hypothetical protein